MNGAQVLITGASGWVGEALVFRLLRDRLFVPVAAVRRSSRLSGLCPSIRFDLDSESELPSLENIKVVVHAAARVHVMHDTCADPLSAFRKTNVEGTVRLAKEAAEAGVTRFVFISSIKVNGEETVQGSPFFAEDSPQPTDPYGVSKWEAESALTALGRETGMEIVIIRPPLVFGPGVKANFLSMMNWLHKGIPLPLGAIHNRRSFVALENLVDLIVTCIEHPAARGNTFLVSDGEDLSTTQLLQRMAEALGKRAYLIPIPCVLLNSAAAMLGKRAMVQRLCGSLQVDMAKTCAILGWLPPVSVGRALEKTARHYLDNKAQ